jgi:hypothetical protein
MKKTAKGILAAIPLVVGLAGPAAAEMSDSSATNGGGSGAIDSLLNQYTGLTPGVNGGGDPTTQAVSAGQRYSAFTGSAGAMASYFTTLGVDLTSPNEPLVTQGGSVGSSLSSTTAGSGADVSSSGSFAAAAPAIAAGTLAHAVQVPQVGDVATSIASASSGGSGSASFNPAAETVLTSEQPLTPAPIPPAAMLLGSGLAALASLRKRNRTALSE